MNTEGLESDLVKILRKRDKAWFVAAASSLGKHPDQVAYSDLAQVSFGEFTSGRAGSDVEFYLGICLPLSVRNKKWTTEQYFNYLNVRSKKTNVNLRLARNRIDPPGFRTTVTIILTSVFLLLLPILIYVLWQFTDLVTFAIYILALLIPTIVSFDYLWTRSYYTRLIRRIDAMRE